MEHRKPYPSVIQAVAVGLGLSLGIPSFPYVSSPVITLAPASGMSRRAFFRHTAAAAAGVYISGRWTDTALANQAEPRGALAPVAQQVKDTSAVVWDPTDILDIPDFFQTMVQAGYTTVWISSYRLINNLTPEQQQTIIDQAKKSGLKTLGFINGNYDWHLQSKRANAARHYDQLIDALLNRWDLGDRMQIAFSTDIEPYIRRFRNETGWSGDLSGYTDLLETVLIPKIQKFASDYRAGRGRAIQKARPILDGPWLTRFEPFWWKNGHVTDDGFTIKGLKDLPRTNTAVMSYRDRAAATIDVMKHQLERAVQANQGQTQPVIQTLVGFETVPEDAAITFNGHEQDLPPAALEVVKTLLPRHPNEVRGIFTHHRSPREAYRIVRQWMGLPAGPMPPSNAPAGPKAKITIQGDKAELAPLQISLRITLPAKDADKKLLAVPFTFTDSWYKQPLDSHSGFKVEEGGAVRVTTLEKSPFVGGKTISRAILLIEAERFDEFIKEYRQRPGQSVYDASQKAYQVIVIDDQGRTHVLDRLPRAAQLKTITTPSTTGSAIQPLTPGLFDTGHSI